MSITSYSPATNIPISGFNSFTLDLYQVIIYGVNLLNIIIYYFHNCSNFQQCIQLKNENVVFSPLSILNALTLLSQATAGTTFEELKRGLYLDNNKATTANHFYELNGLIQNNIGKGNLSIANRIYVKQGYSLNRHFQELAVTKFSSGIESVNFVNNIETAQSINRFVEDKTLGKIKNIIKPDALNGDTAVVLINAINFKGEWLHQFDERLTANGEFFMSKTEKVLVEFMTVTDYFRRKCLNDLDATALEMKYANSKLAFIIILPGTRTGLFPLEMILKNYDLSKIADDLWAPTKMNVIIPKFKVESEINLNDALKNVSDRMF